MAEEFYIRELANGMVLLGQRMDHVSSASICLVVPGGAACDAAGSQGAAAVAGEWVVRGAGERDTRRLNDALDALGCQHHEDVESRHTVFHAAQLGRNLEEVLALYADIVRRPRLADETFEPCRTLALQDLAALDDEPARKCNLMLRERFYPYPLGRIIWGTAESLGGLRADAVRKQVSEQFAPGGSMLAVAGNVDWTSFCDVVERLFADWDTPAPPAAKAGRASGGATHVERASAQAHLGLAHAAPVMADKHYYPARVAVAVLSGGMSSRLFTEVREKRGLVYHVSTRYHSLRERAGFFTYAGAPPAKAPQTLEITVGELRRLADGVRDDEMARACTQLKSALVMAGESTGARAAALANDWYHLRRLRSLQEISDAVDAVTGADVIDCLRAYPAEKFTVLTIGPQPPDLSAVEG